MSERCSIYVPIIILSKVCVCKRERKRGRSRRGFIKGEEGANESVEK